MTLRQAVNNTFERLNNQPNQVPNPSALWGQIVSHINEAIQRLHTDFGEQWRFARRERQLGPVVAGTRVYTAAGIDFPTRQKKDPVYISYTDGSGNPDKTELQFSSGIEVREEQPGYVTFEGGNLVLGAAFDVSDREIGQMFVVPHYPPPEEIDEDTAEAYVIPIPNPWFVVYQAANTLATGNIVRRDQKIVYSVEVQAIVDQMRVNNTLGTGVPRRNRLRIGRYRGNY